MLRVWLPLTKDLRQQGLSNVTVTNNGATYSSTGGKLGGCYNFTTTSWQRITFPYSLANKSKFSVCLWIKIPGTTITGFPFGFCHSGDYWQFVTYNNSVGIRDNASGSTGTRKDYSLGSFVANQWTHLAFTYNAGTLKTYKDGVLFSTNSTGGTAMNDYTIAGSGLGEPITNSSSYYFNGSINDFRVYDHCLSPMEVKELAKGLVLHYPLNRQGWGQENLHKNSDTITSTWSVNQGTVSNGIVTITPTTSSDRRIYQMPANGGWTWQSGKTYTASIDAKSSNGATLIFYPYGAGSMSQSYTVTSEWKRYSFTFTATQSGTSSMTYQVNQTSGVSLQLKHPKLEEGSIATPWCPNSSDTLATTMGLNGTTEYDCSGFCNNGTRTGTFTWTSDTPKYNVSTQFSGTQYIRLPFPCSAISEAVSVAVWGYESNWNTSSAERLIGAATNSSGWCIGDYGSENTLFAFYANGGYNAATGFKQLSAGWHHFVITFDGFNLNYYVDGQPFSSKTFSTKQTATGNYNIEIGRHYGDGCNFKGRMSDVRIYATALSADDVRALYENSAYIDSSGNVYGAVHSEV